MAETDFRYLNKGNKNKTPVIIVGSIVLTLIIVGALLLTRKQGKKVKDVVAATVIKKVSPTEMPKIDKSTIKIQVMNGTGITGQAGNVIKTLVMAGYNSGNIRSTNAEKFDNIKTTLSMRDTFEETAIDVEKILKSTFNEVVISSTRINKYTEFDIIVVTGASVSGAFPPALKPSTRPISSLESVETSFR